MNFNDYSQYNQETIKKLIELDKEVKEELSKEETDNEKLTKLRCAQLMKGLELQMQGMQW